MRRLGFIIACGLSMTVAAVSAEACRVPPPLPIPPRPSADAVAIATVVAGDEYGADLRVDNVLDGSAPARVHIEWGGRTSGAIVVTSCGPPGPVVRVGNRVAVVFMRHEGRQVVSGWMMLDEAARRDDFFLLYPRARAVGERRRLLERWRLVNRHRGPVPLSDPERWAPPHVGGLGEGGSADLVYVSFEVSDDGRIVDCEAHNGIATPRSRTICEGIRHRRFAPPLLARERYGMFRARWAGD